MSTYCRHCTREIAKNKQFCNSSCAAKHNNKNKTLKPRNKCLSCNNECQRLESIYCSRLCSGISRKKSLEHKRALNAASQSLYRAKCYRVIDPTADKQKIKSIYKNCPRGYEVDHIIPLARGGKHHEDNLQYLLKEENRRKNKRMVGDPGYDPSHHAVMSSRPSHLAHPPNR